MTEIKPGMLVRIVRGAPGHDPCLLAFVDGIVRLNANLYRVGRAGGETLFSVQLLTGPTGRHPRGRRYYGCDLEVFSENR